MIQLRPYQYDLIDRARDALREHDSVLIQLPTGGGKTALAAFMLGTAASRGRSAIFACHRIEILEQACATFNDLGIAHGVVMPGHEPNSYYRIHVCSIDTLGARLRRGASMPAADLLCIDEGHHAVSPTWRRVMDAYPVKRVLLSATPQRLDGMGLKLVADALVCGPDVRWLIENGFLSRYRAFAPAAPDVSKVHTRAGDYVQAELEAAMDTPTITGDAIWHYLKLCPGKRAIAFCVSIKHSQHVADKFRAAGVAAIHVDGETPKPQRRAIMDAFRSNEVQVLTSVDIFGEGVDVPGLDASILLRPTKSLALCLQQIGRCLRPAAGKDAALILDHAGNLARHGLPDDEREWSLDGHARRKGKQQEDPVKVCPKCFAAHRPAPVCPVCGFEYEPQPREVAHMSGELAEIDPTQWRKKAAREQARAQSLEELVELGRARGYKPGWAFHVWQSRQQRRAG